MNSAIYGMPYLRTYEKIKYLAEEMAKRIVQLNIGEENDDGKFHKISFINSPKHKSQVFFNRFKTKMYSFFTSNNPIIKDNNDLKTKKRRQSTFLQKPKKRKVGFNHFAHHFSIKSHKSNKSNNFEGKEIEDNLEEKENISFMDVNRIKNDESARPTILALRTPGQAASSSRPASSTRARRFPKAGTCCRTARTRGSTLRSSAPTSTRTSTATPPLRR